MPNTTAYQDLMDRQHRLEQAWIRHCRKPAPWHFTGQTCMPCDTYRRDLEIMAAQARLALRIA